MPHYPDGRYTAKPLTAALTETKAGKPRLVVDFTITSQELANRPIRFSTGLDASEKQFAFAVKALRTCGWTGDDLSSITLSPAEVEITTETREYEGKQHTEVKYVNPLGGPLKHRMDAEKARAFAAQMRQRVAAVDAAMDPRPEPPPVEEPDPF
jgi:hypothetical protein